MRSNKTGFWFCIVLATVFLYQNNACTSRKEQRSPDPRMEIQQQILGQINHFREFVRDTFSPLADRQPLPETELQRDFLKARLLYKKFEWAAEYFAGSLAEMLNGAPVQEIDNADLLDPAMAYAIDPTGLQVIEEYIFPRALPKQRKHLQKEMESLVENSGYLKSFFTDQRPAVWRILDAARLQVFRILTLGITGFDNPLTLQSMEESAVSLQSLKEILRHLKTEGSAVDLTEQIDEAVNYLLTHKDFDSFDRAYFILEFGNPLSRTISELAQKHNTQNIRYNRLLHQDAATLFDPGAFNVNAFAPGAAYHMTDTRVELGQKLFFDPVLSGPGTRSCATCHLPELDFTDGMAKNTNIKDGITPIARNTPTLINAALQSNYFHDMRMLTLEDQALDVIQNPDEMDGSMEEIIRYLSEDPEYSRHFPEAYPKAADTGIESIHVANALASYIRSLTGLDSRFDEYMRGDRSALTREEIDGFNIFMGKAKCATCHFMPLFSGITPPKYIASEAEVIGVPLSASDSIIDPDRGWYDVIGVPSFMFGFKTPTVRNVSRTAPYMHNGIYSTLEEVMEFYNNAGPIGLGFDLENQTLPEDSLHLSENEIEKVVAFMKSLDSR